MPKTSQAVLFFGFLDFLLKTKKIVQIIKKPTFDQSFLVPIAAIGLCYFFDNAKKKTLDKKIDQQKN